MDKYSLVFLSLNFHPRRIRTLPDDIHGPSIFLWLSQILSYTWTILIRDQHLLKTRIICILVYS
jgi:hypothetical protein